MSKRKKATPKKEDTVREVQEYYDNILSSLIDGIIVIDEDSCVTTFSSTAEQMMGVKSGSVQGKKLTEIFEEGLEIHTLVRKTLQTGRSYSDSNFSLRQKFGARHEIGLAVSPLLDCEGRSIGVVIVFRDLSRIKSLEERLRKGERLASLGILSAGMAHEIKNPLGGIRGATQLLHSELGEGHALSEYTEIIVREVDRVNNIVQGLLDFSRPIALKLRSMNLHQIIDHVLSLVRMEDDSNRVQFQRNFDPSLPEIMADPDQITQVFLNLFKNGIDAMGGTGTLTLTTRMLSGYQVQSGEEEKKGSVCINVEDTGCGIDPEDIGKVFDPFFTKKTGGVGLGLALCHRIIEEHAGKIDVTSTPGQGTCFRVSLPIEIRSKSGS